jgi:sodium/bile acid cotransporter 7
MLQRLTRAPAGGPIMLPLVLFHQIQLLVCAIITTRTSRTAPGG